MDIKELLKQKKEFLKQDIVSLLKINDKNSLLELYELANSVREQYVGENVEVRGIITFSNYCSKNCLYCGIRRSNEQINRCRMPSDLIIESAKKAERMGYKTLMLQSGEDDYFDAETISSIIKCIKQSTDLTISLSIGERKESEYRQMKEAGAQQYLLKHETSDPILYRQLHPDMKYSSRIKCLRVLKQLGYETGSGIMVGLPGQTLESIANDILLFQAMNIDMISIVPYLPQESTPLGKKFAQAGGYFVPAIGYFDVEEMIYKIIAIARIVTNNANIPVPPALSIINNLNSQELALNCGANMLMYNITDQEYKKHYEIYSHKLDHSKERILSVNQISENLKNLNRTIR